MDELEQGLPAPNTASDVKASECLISLHASIEPSTHGLQESLQGSPPPTPWRTFSQRAKYYVPGLQWIPHYTLGRFWGDFAAGVSVASVLIPQSMHLDASTGLFAAAIPGAVYALFGTSPHLNVGPEAALSLLIGMAISAIVRGDPHSPAGRHIATSVATVITFQAGCISFLLGFLRLGFIDVVLNRALLRGFITAVAVVIMVEQLIPMIGIEDLQHEQNPSPHTTLEKIFFLLRFAAIGPRWAWIKYIPEVFILVVVSTILSGLYGWREQGVSILGRMTVDTGNLFDFPLTKHTTKYFKQTTSTAILISIAGYLDSIVGAKQNSDRFGYSISPNRELVALATTQMASLVCSALVILAVVFVLPALTNLPKCVLGAVIGLVVNSILSETPHDFGYFWRMSAWTDLAMMCLTFIFTVAWSVEVGIIVSVTSSLLIIVRRSSMTHIKILDTNQWRPVDEDPLDREEVPGVLIVRLREDLDFANTGQLKERLRRLELYGARRVHPSETARRAEARAVVFHMADVEEIDASAAQIFSQLTTTYKSRNVQVHFAHLHEEQLAIFRTAGIVPDIVPATNIHELSV
ncbi:hypothetical protein BS47DRAFT_1370775 [Hydnum rufescens UP504]|uniref:STAS domain-containing protein n=1 Tax=Hydnum rufescens UP504 TaxID=1448309 RepID=A0A9P6DYE5_9AGAM|nr:hypothetical protein BS47DRAFT_1370775 [Hydnum rufescens UP504]